MQLGPAEESGPSSRCPTSAVSHRLLRSAHAEILQLLGGLTLSLQCWKALLDGARDPSRVAASGSPLRCPRTGCALGRCTPLRHCTLGLMRSYC